MKIFNSPISPNWTHNVPKTNASISHSSQNQCEGNSLECLGAYNKANVSFKGYFGDKQPAKKLFWIATGRNHIYRDEETEQNSTPEFEENGSFQCSECGETKPLSEQSNDGGVCNDCYNDDSYNK